MPGRGGGEGVRTRDHLASVRTTLVWVRAAIVLMAAGYTLDKLARLGALPGEARPLGLAGIVVGVAVAVMALVRHLAARRRIESETFEPSLSIDLVLIGVLVVGAVVVFILLGSSP
jgi:putative membrane protein